MFRGTELPRLLLLLAIIVVGAPILVRFARPGVNHVAPVPPRLQAASLKPVVPEQGVEFQAITDKSPVQGRESAAYAELLRRARQTPSSELATAARKDILYTHLWERPERYRGVPIHIEGTAKRILTYEVNPELAPSGRLFEAWVYSDENRVVPYVLIFADPPKDLVIGPDLFVRVKFDGYFMKLLRYTASDHARAAPMLVGRLTTIPKAADAPAPMVEFRNFARRDGFIIVFVLLLGYIAIRAFFVIRKALFPGRPKSARISQDLERSPDEILEWLQNFPDEEVDDRDFPEDPGPRPR
ncbi:hypothetical protein P12x_004273 [Tundrisphaera lichenicola]|uniref:hypothetical protein n=1 Tax=Tundrisphaera lichenicola TaxID=2029860 RepID=UPI003EB7AFBC